MPPRARLSTAMTLGVPGHWVDLKSFPIPSHFSSTPKSQSTSSGHPRTQEIKPSTDQKAPKPW